MTILLLLLFLSSVVVGACVLLWRILRARDKRLLLGGTRALASDAPDGIGISVLCCGVFDSGQIENLLSVEYARYEVVVVLDSRLYPAQFELLVARYRMIRVEWTASDELPVAGVRAMGRSRKRSYRRLVLIDRAQDTPQGDLDAAAAIAVYDYLLPVCPGQRLLPDAIARLVAELGEHSAGAIWLVRSWIGEPTVLVHREAVVAAGGFGQKPLRGIPRERRRVLWEPLLCTPEACRSLPRWVGAVGMLLLAAGIAASVMAGWWPVVAVLLTVALLRVMVCYGVAAVSDVSGECSGKLFSGLCRGCKLRMKNFTVS